MPDCSSSPDKRLVLTYTQGPRAGMAQIFGTERTFRAQTSWTGALPSMIAPGTPACPHGASLIRCTPRFWHYRECNEALVGIKDRQNGRGGDTL